MRHLEFEKADDYDDDDETKKRLVKGNNGQSKHNYRDIGSPAAKSKGRKTNNIFQGDEGIGRRILCIMAVIALVGIAVHFYSSSGKTTIKIDMNLKKSNELLDIDLVSGIDKLEQKIEKEEQKVDMEDADLVSGIDKLEQKIQKEEEKADMEDLDLVSGIDKLEQKIQKEEEKADMEDLDLLAVELPDDVENNDDKRKRTYSNMATMEPDPWDTPHLHSPHYNDSTREELIEKFGKWKFWDGQEGNRPLYEDYCAKYPNRDIPGDDFPDDAWQVDAVYVNHILNDADKLISRAMEAIFTEYGNGKPLASAEMFAVRRQMFKWEQLDSLEGMDQPPPAYRRRGNRGNGGWTTKRSFDGLVRRLLHAIMTRDTFTIVMGGHSAAVGQGNHFRQSYMMQMHSVLSPILSRLGVKLTTRNMAQGGLGTVHSSLGSSSIYGNEVDLLLWDSGMTENALHHHIDLFLRQGLIGGNRVPVIWGGNFHALKFLHDNVDADIGEYGSGMDGIKETTSPEQAETLPYSMRYMKCSSEAAELCKANDKKYCATCWINRDDGIQPEAKQYDKPKGQVSWHPGWRSHLLQGRVLTFSVLDALQKAIQIFSEQTMGGPPLDDELWHVTEYYENIRTKVRSVMDEGDCKGMEEINHLPKRLCTTPMKAFTQYTPRANFEQTALTSIIKPASNGYVPYNKKKALYKGPDAHNQCFDLPDNDPSAVDVRFIVSARIRRKKNRHLQQQRHQRQHYNNATTTTTTAARTITTTIMNNEKKKNSTLESSSQKQQLERKKNETITFSSTAFAGSSIHNTQQQTRATERRRNEEIIVPGKGWEVIDEPQGVCDGTYNAICARSTDNPCVLYGHHDARGSVVGSELSGWLVMTIPRVKEGLILIKLHTWHYESENPLTHGWTTVNNNEEQQPPPQRRRRKLLRLNSNNGTTTTTSTTIGNINASSLSSSSSGGVIGQQRRRELIRSVETPTLCDGFAFDYAIDGKITSLNREEFLEKKQDLQRVVEVLTLLDDPNYTGGGEAAKDVEVAVRLRGCGRQIVFGVSHIYYA